MGAKGPKNRKCEMILVKKIKQAFSVKVMAIIHHYGIMETRWNLQWGSGWISGGISSWKGLVNTGRGCPGSHPGGVQGRSGCGSCPTQCSGLGDKLGISHSLESMALKVFPTLNDSVRGSTQIILSSFIGDLISFLAMFRRQGWHLKIGIGDIGGFF